MTAMHQNTPGKSLTRHEESLRHTHSAVQPTNTPHDIAKTRHALSRRVPHTGTRISARTTEEVHAARPLGHLRSRTAVPTAGRHLPGGAGPSQQHAAASARRRRWQPPVDAPRGMRASYDRRKHPVRPGSCRRACSTVGNAQSQLEPRPISDFAGAQAEAGGSQKGG